jgi:hypothetical protein
MAIPSKKFNWVRSPSAWQQAQAWREKRRAMVEQFQNNATMLSDGFYTAQQDKIMGTASLAAEAAGARIQAKIKAKLDTFA